MVHNKYLSVSFGPEGAMQGDICERARKPQWKEDEGVSVNDKGLRKKL